MNTTSQNSKPKLLGALSLLGYVSAAVAIWIAVSLRQDQETLKSERTALTTQISRLEGELESALSLLDAERMKRTSKQEEKKTPTQPKFNSEPESLHLTKPSVSKTPRGLTVRFGFKLEEGAELPDQIALVARVPAGKEAKIKSFAPVSESGYANLGSLVNSQGTLGMIEGSPAELSALQYELTVSAPVNVSVRGSAGIKDFELSIAPDGCTVRKL